MSPTPIPRTALVTGGTRGLGRALVDDFGRRGYRVYATARRQPELDRLAGEARRAALDVVALRGDVTDVDDNQRVARRVADDGRRLDVVIHNAGLLGAPRTPLADYPPDVFRRVTDVNLFGPFDLTRQLLGVLADGAALLFVSSGAAAAPRAGWGAYSVTKIAVEALAGIWARELRGRGVRVYVVDPGAMRTGMRHAAYPDEDPATLDPPADRVEAFRWLAEQGTLDMSGERFLAYDFRPAPR